jgi:hypothetical protein
MLPYRAAAAVLRLRTHNERTMQSLHNSAGKGKCMGIKTWDVAKNS